MLTSTSNFLSSDSATNKASLPSLSWSSNTSSNLNSNPSYFSPLNSKVTLLRSTSPLASVWLDIFNSVFSSPPNFTCSVSTFSYIRRISFKD